MIRSREEIAGVRGAVSGSDQIGSNLFIILLLTVHRTIISVLLPNS